MILSEKARTILESFAESYPLSAHYRDGRRLRKGGWEKKLPEIERDVDEKELFLEAVTFLCREGVISVRWKRFREGDRVEAIYLESPERLYELLGRPHPGDQRDGMLAEAESILSAGTTARTGLILTSEGRFILEQIREMLRFRHPVPIRDVQELRDLALLFSLDRQTAQAYPLRALSVRLYRDSKRLERILPIADRLSSAAAGEKISGILNLDRKFPEVSFALEGSLVSDTGASWELGGEIITLPGDTLERIRMIRMPESCPDRSRSPRLLSIENKESFYTFAGRLRMAKGKNEAEAQKAFGSASAVDPSFHGVLLCAGHPNSAVARLLTLIRGSGAGLHHFGDMDPDGLLIFQELDDAFGGGILPFRMNPETYARYLPFGYRLSPAQLSRLTSVRHPAMRSLAEEIGRHRIGVEQEVIE